MARRVKHLVTPRIILLVAAVVLLIYVAYDENQTERIAGCWDCGWETRHAFYLVLAVAGLFIVKWWTLSLSLLLGLKVLYVMGRVTFWNSTGEVDGVWRRLNSALQWSVETHVEFFALLGVATIVVCYAAFLLRRVVSN